LIYGPRVLKGHNFLMLPQIWVLVIKMLRASHKSHFRQTNCIISQLLI